MPNENDEKTKELYDLDDLTNANNEIFEVNNTPMMMNEPIEEQPKDNFFEEPKKKKKLKEKIKTWWHKLTKKQKSLFIVGMIILVIIIGLGIFFVVRSFTKEKTSDKPADVIVLEENYRYENGTLIFLNNRKEEIGSYTCKNQKDTLCFVSYYSNEDDFDIEKKVYQDGTPILMRSPIINNMYVFINDNSKETDTTIELYNIKEKKVEESYSLVKKVSGNTNRLIVKNAEGKYGVLDFSNTEVMTKINFTFDYLGYVENDSHSYVSKIDNATIIVDENGNTISKPLNGKIKNVTNSYVKIASDTGKYEVYNYNGQNVFEEAFDYVELYNDYAILINDNKMSLKYYDKNKLNEEAISLSNKNYVKTSVYDEKNALIETKESFRVEDNENIITITIVKDKDTTTATINKMEANLSKNLKNINYFDGKLYIYSDSAKTNLLGSYACSNKNTVSAGTNTLTNCSLARDSIFENNDYEVPGVVGVIPVFNERFIFINDNPELVNDSNKTIVLYDLKKNSVLGKYMEVNTYSYTGTEEITFSTVNELQVVAKNKSNKFGVIKIGLSEVSGHISFNYSEMESLHDYYVAKDANGYLLLSKSNGSSISSAIPYKIRNYNDQYVKVVNNDKYYVYNLKGKQITTEGYRYVELYNAFFAGVNNNNKLGIYTYKYPTTNEIEGVDSTLSLTNYYGNGTLAFKVETSGLNYKVYRGTSANTYDMITTGTIEKEED